MSREYLMAKYQENKKIVKKNTKMRKYENADKISSCASLLKRL